MSDAISDIQWFIFAGFFVLGCGIYSLMNTVERIQRDIDKIHTRLDDDRGL